MYGGEKAKPNIQFIHCTVILNADFFSNIDLLLINKIKFSMLCDCVSMLYQVEEDLSVQARNDQALLIHPFKCKRFGNNHEDKGMTRKLEFFYEPIYRKVMLERCV